jgi:hypothetical protein
MPLDVRRLLTSETWIDASEEPRLAHALICLWAESWHQVPAASLPDNDRVLARFTMCDKETWRALRQKALKGWIKCSDGLLYHPVVAEKALEAWNGKKRQKERTRAATEARQRQRTAQQDAANGERDGDTDDVRNGERDVDRHDDRNGVQGRGIGIGRERGAASPLPPAEEQPQKATKPRRERKNGTRQNNLATLESFEPTGEQLAGLRLTYPRVAHKLDVLVKDFKTRDHYRRGFERGKYSDPERTFENFVSMKEGDAADKGVPLPPPPKPPRALPASGDPYSEQ